MTEKQIIKTFIVNTFDCSEYYFELVWKHITASYGKSLNLRAWRMGLSVLYDHGKTDKQHDTIKAASILYEAIKEVEKTGKIEQFLLVLEEASKKHRAEEELKLKILKNVESVTKEISDFLKGVPLEGKHATCKNDTLELSVNEMGKPIAKINGKNITIKERFFVDLAYLAAHKLKRQSKWVDVRKGLMWTERHIKDYPTDFKETLERGAYLNAKDNVLERLKGQGMVRLGVFNSGAIIINENLCNFVSKHYWTVKKTIDDISYDLSCRKAGGRKIDSKTTDEAIENQEINLEKIDTQELRPMIRHTYVMMQTANLMGWKYHDTEWIKEWKGFLRKCERIYGLVSDVKYEETRKYLHMFLSLFSRIS